METWHPLGVVGVISAFNFPVAVWSWNAAVALVCGDTVVWKPSDRTPLTAIACAALLARARATSVRPRGSHAAGPSARRDVGERSSTTPRVALLSAPGRSGWVAPWVRGSPRGSACLLELGGNNAAMVAPSADLDLAVRGIVFSAAGTAGQRCTSLRRVIVHSSVADELVARISSAYGQLKVGNPFDDGVLVGPLVERRARTRRIAGALDKARPTAGRRRAAANERR